MKLGKIGGGGENPFLKKPFEDVAGHSSSNNLNVDGAQHAGKTDEAKKAGDADKIGMKDASASSNAPLNTNAKLDKGQFTKEDEMQEVDLQDFEDDF